MRLLILGGSAFLGRHTVDAALAAGHEVTVFNRGTQTHIWEQVEELRGDRYGDLSALAGRTWDVVIDTSAYAPAVVRHSTGLLADNVERYIIISTMSVYAGFGDQAEDAPLAEIGEEEARAADAIRLHEGIPGMSFEELYGPLKVLCERAAEAAMPERVAIVRPGLIVGPWDTSDRFTYWPHRVAAGGQVLAPGSPERAIRVIDARDLAAWLVRVAEARRTSVYNAGGEQGETMGSLLDACVRLSGSGARLIWVPESFLLDRGVGQWQDLPLWLAEEYNGLFAGRDDRAITAGLTYRPLADTVRATLAWDRTRPAGQQWRAGLSRERESELLREWGESLAVSCGASIG